jgi:hypothetical protein
MAQRLAQVGPEAVARTKIHQRTSQLQALVEIHSSVVWVLASAAAVVVALVVLEPQAMQLAMLAPVE